MAADFGAFAPGPRIRIAPTSAGPLDGLRFAVKDNIDVAGVTTGAGNPDWAAAASPASTSAPCVLALLAAGATLVGKTLSDELAFSLEGRNGFYGTPANPACPDRLPGGSSSGSAVAVAAGLADFALGTDTGGSVRVPASFCGVYGFRPTHGRISLDRVVPLAASYDTIGWFARDANVLAQVGSVLLGAGAAPVKAVEHRLLAQDAFDMLDAACRQPLIDAAAILGTDGDVRLFNDEPALFHACYRVLQGAEIWQALGPWITAARPRFAADIAARFTDAASISPQEVGAMQPVRHRLANHIRAVAQPGTVIVLPTSPTQAHRLDADSNEIGRFYAKALALTSIAGHAGLPQISIPGATSLDGNPIGLSLIGWPNGDEALLHFAASR